MLNITGYITITSLLHFIILTIHFHCQTAVQSHMLSQLFSMPKKEMTRRFYTMFSAVVVHGYFICKHYFTKMCYFHITNINKIVWICKRASKINCYEFLILVIIEKVCWNEYKFHTVFVIGGWTDMDWIYYVSKLINYYWRNKNMIKNSFSVHSTAITSFYTVMIVRLPWKLTACA